MQLYRLYQEERITCSRCGLHYVHYVSSEPAFYCLMCVEILLRGSELSGGGR